MNYSEIGNCYEIIKYIIIVENIMLIQTIVVNDRLGMTKGEIASQIAHAQIKYIGSVLKKHTDFQCSVETDCPDLYLHEVIMYQRWIKSENIEIVVKKGNWDQIMHIMGDAAVKRVGSHLSYNIIPRISREKVVACVIVEPMEHDLVNKLTDGMENL